MSTPRQRIIVAALGRGALAGAAGVGAMTVAEKVEQRLSGRPSSFVPGRALEVVAGRHPSDADTPVMANLAIHWGTGIVLGALRGAWSATGIRGPEATSAHTVVRLAFDQTVENLSGVGAPPTTWPARERVMDYAMKATYAAVTGVLADRWIRPEAQVERGTTSH